MIGKAGFVEAAVVAVCASVCGAETVPLGDAVHNVRRLDLGPGENALLLHDVNSDGKLDLVAALQEQDRIAVRRGDGAGGFENFGSYAAGEQPTWVDAADINSDGHVDLVIANHERPYLTLLLGDGSGGFEPAENSPLQVAVEPHPHMVAAEDLDNDGIVDLIVDSRDKYGVFVLKGTGNGQFKSPGVGVNVHGEPYLGFALADLNGDKRLDLITPNRRDVAVLMRRPSPPIAFERVQSLAFASPFAVRIADFNGDAHPDLIVASDHSGPNVRLYLGDGSGRFPDEAAATFTLSSGGKDIAIGDVDGDGFRDAVIVSWNADARVIRGGDSAFASKALPLAGLKAPWGVAIGDLNGDGRGDILVADGAGSQANLYLSRN